MTAPGRKRKSEYSNCKGFDVRFTPDSGRWDDRVLKGRSRPNADVHSLPAYHCREPNWGGKTMTLEEFNYIAEIIGSIAIIASLIYVALQVRQNTIAVRLSTLHDVKDTIREVNLLVAEQGDLAEILFEGFQGLDKLSGAPRARFYTWAHNLFLGYENLYLQYLGGALDPRHWSGMAQHMTDVSSVPGLQAYWADRRQWFTEEFRNYWENEVSPAPADPGYRAMGTR